MARWSISKAFTIVSHNVPAARSEVVDAFFASGLRSIANSLPLHLSNRAATTDGAGYSKSLTGNPNGGKNVARRTLDGAKGMSGPAVWGHALHNCGSASAGLFPSAQTTTAIIDMWLSAVISQPCRYNGMQRLHNRSRR